MKIYSAQGSVCSSAFEPRKFKCEIWPSSTFAFRRSNLASGFFSWPSLRVDVYFCCVLLFPRELNHARAFMFSSLNYTETIVSKDQIPIFKFLKIEHSNLKIGKYLSLILFILLSQNIQLHFVLL